MDGGTGGGSYEAGIQVPVTANAAPAGKVFDRWVSSSGGTFTNATQPSTTFTMPANNVTVTATYRNSMPAVPDPNTYRVVFDPNGGIADTTQMTTGTDGRIPALPAAIRDGYTFNGWYTIASGGDRITTDTVFNGDTIVYAQWTYIGASTPSTPSNPGGWHPSNYNPPVTSYSISVLSVTGGTVSVSPTPAVAGSTVTITTTPNAGYELATLTVTDTNGRSLELTDKGDGKYTFKMPNSKVSLSTAFRPIGAVMPWSNPFVDVAVRDWYYDAVKFVHENGLMNGVGNSSFAPNANLSRTMLARVLYNKEGRSIVGNGNVFNDVRDGAWYADAVAWATGKGIITGYGNSLFGPDDDITREQFVVMLYRYAGSPVPPNLLLNFTDAHKISVWAQDAVRWAVAQGILSGKGNGILDPTGKATRAEAAQMLKNYLEK